MSGKTDCVAEWRKLRAFDPPPGLGLSAGALAGPLAGPLGKEMGPNQKRKEGREARPARKGPHGKGHKPNGKANVQATLTGGVSKGPHGAKPRKGLVSNGPAKNSKGDGVMVNGDGRGNDAVKKGRWSQHGQKVARQKEQQMRKGPRDASVDQRRDAQQPHRLKSMVTSPTVRHGQPAADQGQGPGEGAPAPWGAVTQQGAPAHGRPASVAVAHIPAWAIAPEQPRASSARVPDKGPLRGTYKRGRRSTRVDPESRPVPGLDLHTGNPSHQHAFSGSEAASFQQAAARSCHAAAGSRQATAGSKRRRDDARQPDRRQLHPEAKLPPHLQATLPPHVLQQQAAPLTQLPPHVVATIEGSRVAAVQHKDRIVQASAGQAANSHVQQQGPKGLLRRQDEATDVGDDETATQHMQLPAGQPKSQNRDKHRPRDKRANRMENRAVEASYQGTNAQQQQKHRGDAHNVDERGPRGCNHELGHAVERPHTGRMYEVYHSVEEDQMRGSQDPSTYGQEAGPAHDANTAVQGHKGPKHGALRSVVRDSKGVMHNGERSALYNQGHVNDERQDTDAAPAAKKLKREAAAVPTQEMAGNSNWLILQQQLKAAKTAVARAVEAAAPDGGLQARKGVPEMPLHLRKVTVHPVKVTQVVALDCEMVGVGSKGRNDRVARVSVVNDFSDVLIDTFVHVEEKVTDYRTKWSGVRRGDLVGAPTAAAVCKAVAEVLAGRVLVGHAVHHDLQALGVQHPEKDIRDTSQYPRLRKILPNGRTTTPSLKALAAQELGMDIQSGEHSSVEDARAALYLYHKYRRTWEQGLRETHSA